MGSTTLPWNPDEITGPEISTPETSGEGLVAPGQEALLKEFEEGPAVDEDKILGKFNNAEELAKAYSELERKLGEREATPTDTQPSSEGYTRDQAVETYGDQAVEALGEKGLDLADLMWRADSGDDISEHYEALAETFGVSKQVVENYVSKAQAQPVASGGSAELTDADAAELKAMVGGDEQFNALSRWAGDNLDATELADYNAVVDSGNKDAIRWALKSLMSMQSAPRRQEPKLIGGRPPSAEPTFNSKQQVLNAMNKKDERGRRLYDVDPAYREKVSEALARSNVF